MIKIIFQIKNGTKHNVDVYVKNHWENMKIIFVVLVTPLIKFYFSIICIVRCHDSMQKTMIFNRVVFFFYKVI